MPALINLTGKPIYVHVGDKVKRLPEGPTPHLITLASGSTPLNVTVPSKKGKKQHHGEIRVDSRDGEVLTCGEPPQLDDVLYLVTPETMYEYPDRTDFVTPASYYLNLSRKLLKAVKKGNRKAGEKMLSDRRYILASVHQHPLATAADASSSLEDLLDD